MSKVITTRVADDGLRYAAKAPGTPFKGVGNTRSCFYCGKHRQPSQLKTRRVLGRTEMVCSPSCDALGG
jgi:hypothetical protein